MQDPAAPAAPPPFGAIPDARGAVDFRVWAPGHASLALEAEGETRPMDEAGSGFFTARAEGLGSQARYRFVLPDGTRLADPASRYQPEGVHGPSEVVDPTAYRWETSDWRGRPWAEAVLYELHIGAFTREGTFRAAIDRLDHLADLGVTALQIMPVAAFSGRRSWGYDGVMPFACDAAYGRPEDFKALIDAAHARGLMALLDVVYNHFGPDGNVLPALAPAFFTDRHPTPWGDGIAFDGPDSRPVRDFFVGNALRWIEEFRLDGLRLDAVHAIQDDSETHILREIAETVRARVADRPVHLVLENEDNAARWLGRDGAGRPPLYTAQWNDDVHHALHVACTGESDGYYGDYLDDTEKLGRALAEGFAFQGEVMEYRGSARGEPSAGLPPAAFVAFLQNHDQVGNRALGDRIDALAEAEAVRACGALLSLLPQIPMLFMGEEWGATQPFPFFADFEEPLASAVRDGRRAEFAGFPAFADPAARESIPDPVADDTFGAAKLRWDNAAAASLGEPAAPGADRLAWRRKLLALRREAIVPLIPRIARGGRFRVVGPGAVSVRWEAEGGVRLALDANLHRNSAAGFDPPEPRRLWLEGAEEGGGLSRWSVLWSVSDG